LTAPRTARTATIVAVGDLQLGDSPTTVGFGFYSRYAGRSLTPLFTDVHARLAAADLAFGNMECTLSLAGLVNTSWASVHLRGEPGFARELKQAGFNIVNVANNHASQHGDETFHETVRILREEGIAVCGVRGTDGWTTEPAMVARRPDARLGVLAYCQRPRQYANAVPPYAEGTLETICADVRRLRPAVDHVVVSLHWGEEFVGQPSRDEVAMARAIIDAGARVIIGHHPHVVRPVEQYGDAIIAYSLGNFVADMLWQEPFRQGAVLECTVPPTGAVRATVSATYIDADYRPAITGERPVVRPADIPGLPPDEYQREIDRTVSMQRKAGYLYALRNLHRFPPRIVGFLLLRTARHRVSRAYHAAIGKPLPY
jgi:poly-gamma-glutamate synthesis protein (capsule biosynthesis protein)